MIRIDNISMDTMNAKILDMLKKYPFFSKLAFAKTIGIKTSLLNSRLKRNSIRGKKHTPQLYSLLISIEKAILTYVKETRTQRTIRIFGDDLYLLRKTKKLKVGDDVFLSGCNLSDFRYFYCGRKGDTLPKIVEIKKNTAILSNEGNSVVFLDDLYKVTKYVPKIQADKK